MIESTTRSGGSSSSSSNNNSATISHGKQKIHGGTTIAKLIKEKRTIVRIIGVVIGLQAGMAIQGLAGILWGLDVMEIVYCRALEARFGAMQGPK